MIVTRSQDGTTEIVVYENDRIVIAFNRGGICVARIFISPDVLAGPPTDITVPAPAPTGEPTC